MNWFKSIKNWLRSEERIEAGIGQERPEEKPVKGYKTAQKIGDRLVIIFKDYTVVDVNDPKGELLSRLDSMTEDQIRSVAAGRKDEADEEEDIEIEESDLTILEESEDFVVNGKVVTIANTKIPIPDDIVANFVEILEKKKIARNNKEDESTFDDQYSRLMHFWLKLANSPVEDRDNVMLFCTKNDVRISKKGNLIGYRRVVTIEKVDYLFKHVEEQFAKIKGWKQTPQKYEVYKNKLDERSLITVKSGKVPPETDQFKWEHVGNLGYLKSTLVEQKSDVYTSYHNSGRYTFKIGDVYKLAGDDIADPNVGNCNSGGLHFSSKYGYNYSGFGDTPIVVLINPSKAIHVPEGDNGKARTTEMKIVCIDPTPDQHIDEKLIEQADEEYNDYTLDELRKITETKDFTPITIDENHVPETSLKDVKEIVKILESRVKSIV